MHSTDDITPQLTAHIAGLELSRILDDIESPEPDTEPEVVLHDNVPAAVAASLLEKRNADVALVSTSEGRRYISRARLAPVIARLKQTWEHDPSAAAPKGPGPEAIPEGVPTEPFEMAWARALVDTCELWTCYKCKRDGMYFLGPPAECPRDPNDPVEEQPSTDPCCP